MIPSPKRNLRIQSLGRPAHPERSPFGARPFAATSPLNPRCVARRAGANRPLPLAIAIHDSVWPLIESWPADSTVETLVIEVSDELQAAATWLDTLPWSDMSGTEWIVALSRAERIVRGDIREQIATDAVLTLNAETVHLFNQRAGSNWSLSYAQRLLAILGLPEHLLMCAHSLHLTAEQLGGLLDLNNDEREAVLALRTREKYSAGEARELMRSLLFCRGRNFNPREWARAAVGEGGKSAATARLQAVARPGYEQQRSQMDSAISALAWPSSMRLQPPENLEGDTVSCYFRFSSDREFKDCLDKLHDSYQSGGIRALLETLND